MSDAKRERSSRRRALAALALLLFAAPALAGERPVLALDGEGGDAWSFEKRIAGAVYEGRCDTILVTSPEGAVPAQRSDGRFHATVTLASGANAVRAVCREADGEESLSPPQEWTVRLRDVPKARVAVRPVAGGAVLDAGATEPAPVDAAPIARWEWRARPGNPAPLFVAGADAPLDRAPAEGETLRLAAPARDGDYDVTLHVTDAKGRSDESTAVFRVKGGAVRTVDLAHEHPSWVENAVVYGAVPSLFGPHGLADLTARLDTIAALGVNVIWLSPVMASPKGDFGYAVTDPFRVRPSLGSEADLKALIDGAHARGIRVILDFVANHLSDESPYYLSAHRYGEASPYHAFFDRDAKGEVTHYFDWANLANLNYANPEVQRYVIAAAAHWVRDLHVDGFRVDASWGVRERAPDFWPRWRAELKRIDPDILLVAEASARDPYYARHGFDAAYDWTDRLGQWAWHDAFGKGKPTAAILRAAITNDGKGADPATLVFRFLNNNDTGERFVARYGPAVTRVAAAMLLTLPGIPCLYMGDAIGARFEPYGEHAPLDWQDPDHLFDDYARLVALREATPPLRGHAIDMVATSDGDRVLAYRRPGATPEEDVLVLLNYGDAPATVALGKDEGLAALLGVPLVDLLQGDTVTLDPAAPAVALPADGVRILRRAPAGRGRLGASPGAAPAG